jgi:hypothetical protein
MDIRFDSTGTSIKLTEGIVYFLKTVRLAV